MNRLIRNVVLIFSFIVLVLSIFWLYDDWSWEPAVVLITAIISVIVLFIRDSTDNEIRKKTHGDINAKSLISISKLIVKIDNGVLRKVRGLKTEKYKPLELTDYYNKFISNLSKRKNLQINHLHDFINSNDFMPILSNEVDFTVTIEKGFKKLELKNHSGKIVRINKPRLMWECSCYGKIRKNKHNCPIHKGFSKVSAAKNFTKDFRNGLVLIRYDNLKIFWVNKKDLWPPSIDSFNLIENLKAEGYHKKKINSVLDIGAGTGFLGIWLSKNNKSIRKVDFSDWLLLPLFFSKANMIFNSLETKSNYLLGLNTSWFSYSRIRKKYDIVICNPPYLPELGFDKIGKESTVAGTQLLISIIKHGLEIGKEVIISFSDIVLPEAHAAAHAAGVTLNKFGTSHTVPFRVPIALRQKGYMEKLVNERKLVEKKDTDFRFWHTINAYSIKRLPTGNMQKEVLVMDETNSG
jgi:hypothetical protein